MRIVGGKFRGRPLASPRQDLATRPTSDRVRESVFNVLEHGADYPALEGAKVIDLFAGTGALGLEALSRGATYCLFVEENAAARALIRENVESFSLQGITRIFRRDATDLGPAGARDTYRVAFLDPPYGRGLAEKALAALDAGKWLAPDAAVIVEERAGVTLSPPAAFVATDARTYGDTTVTFLLYRPARAPDATAQPGDEA